MRFLIVLLLLLTVLPGQVLAFGSAASGTRESVAPGEDAGFKILFYNLLEHETITIELTTDAPPGWSVVLSRMSLDLPRIVPNDRVPEEGVEYLGSPIGDLKVRPIFVNIQAPHNQQEGSATVTVTARTRLSESGIIVRSERRFPFTITIDPTKPPSPSPEPPPPTAEAPDSPGTFFPLIPLALLIIYLLLRRRKRPSRGYSWASGSSRPWTLSKF